jgi:hypothetical protein
MAKRQKALEKELADLKRGQQRVPESQVGEEDIDINGIWYGNNAVYNITQRGNGFTIQEANAYNVITAVGEGRIDGQNIEVSYRTALNTQGRLRLTIFDGGGRLEVTFSDLTMGTQGPFRISRQ